MRNVIMVSSLAVVLSGCCTHQQSRPAVKSKTSIAPVGVQSSVRRASYQTSGLLRVPDQTHIYRVGRLPEGDSMREAGNYYHVEQSAYWNRFEPNSRPLVMGRVRVKNGPSDTAAAKAYRVVPDDSELTELRNEARAEKDKTAEELTKAKLTREKLEGLTQGLAQTDQVIKAAQGEISELKIQNDELRHRAVMQDNEKPAADFGKIERIGKQPKTEGLEPEPGSDD